MELKMLIDMDHASDVTPYLTGTHYVVGKDGDVRFNEGTQRTMATAPWNGDADPCHWYNPYPIYQAPLQPIVVHEPTREMKPHKCPVCDGDGARETLPMTTSGDNRTPCRPCNGSGIVWG